MPQIASVAWPEMSPLTCVRRSLGAVHNAGYAHEASGGILVISCPDCWTPVALLDENPGS